jgi:hypothetical protein
MEEKIVTVEESWSWDNDEDPIAAALLEMSEKFEEIYCAEAEDIDLNKIFLDIPNMGIF